MDGTNRKSARGKQARIESIKKHMADIVIFLWLLDVKI